MDDNGDIPSVIDALQANPAPFIYCCVFAAIAIGTLWVYFHWQAKRKRVNRHRPFYAFREAKITFERNLKLLLEGDENPNAVHRPLESGLPPRRDEEMTAASPGKNNP